MKQKILIIASHLSTGGAPQFTLNKIELLKEVYDVYCVEYDFLSPDFVVQRNKIIEILGDKFYPLYDNKFKLIEIVNEVSPDIISIEEISETFMRREIIEILYSEKRSWKIVETTHSSYDNSRFKCYLPDKFIFVSPHSLEMYKHLGVDSCVIEYPVDKKFKNKKLFQEKLGFDKDKIHILNVGLFTSGKNQGYAFEIARKLQDKNYVFHFVGNLAGNFQEYWAPIMETKPENCVIWGEKNNVDEFIQASDLFLFTSKLELNPLVIKEVLCYNTPILMFNLNTYGGCYNDLKNCSFLTGDVNVDSKNLLSKIEDKPKKGYVFYSSDKYFEIVKKSVKSIRNFSDLPIYVYLLNSEKKLDIENVYTINWDCDINIEENMYIADGSNFYINRGSKSIYNILIQRPKVVKHVLENFLDIAVYVDSDSISTRYVDNIFDMYPENLDYPYFVEGVYDYLFYNGRGGAWSKDDLTTTLEHPGCELFGVNQKIRERYRQTGYFISNKKCISFLEEWSSMCENPIVLENNELFAPYNEETIVNILLWKKGILDGLPNIYSNGTLETIDKIYNEIGFKGYDNLLENWLRIPSIKENLLFIHGEKNTEVMDKMIEKLNKTI